MLAYGSTSSGARLSRSPGYTSSGAKLASRWNTSDVPPVFMMCTKKNRCVSPASAAERDVTRAAYS